MKPSSITIVALSLIALSLLAWAGVWFEYQTIDAMRVAHVQALSKMQGTAAREAARSRMRALTLETAADRAILSTSIRVDVIEAAKSIESVGVAAHTDLKVTSVAKQAGSVPAAAAAHPLHAIDYSVEATGSFAAIMKTAQLLDALPLPSAVTQSDMALIPSDPSGKSGPVWRLTARVRLLTDAELP